MLKVAAVARLTVTAHYVMPGRQVPVTCRHPSIELVPWYHAQLDSAWVVIDARRDSIQLIRGVASPNSPRQCFVADPIDKHACPPHLHCARPVPRNMATTSGWNFRASDESRSSSMLAWIWYFVRILYLPKLDKVWTSNASNLPLAYITQLLKSDKLITLLKCHTIFFLHRAVISSKKSQAYDL